MDRKQKEVLARGSQSHPGARLVACARAEAVRLGTGGGKQSNFAGRIDKAWAGMNQVERAREGPSQMICFLVIT